MATREMESSVAGLRDQAFAELRAAMPAANLEAALRCSVKLHAELPRPGQLERNLVLVAYGGGKDSSYMLAFVRAMQLILFRVYGSTFRLRVATNRHAGMPRAVLENVDREYQALRLYDDPDCELLLIDGNEVAPFDVDSPQREAVIARNRLDILMTGHRTFGDGRPTFCNACNLSVFNSFGLAAAYGNGADLIITGDSKEEQREYTVWVGRLSRRLAAVQGPGQKARARRANGAGQPPQGSGLGRLLSHLDRIAQSYFTDIHGSEATDVLAERRVTTDVPEGLRFFSVYSDTAYAAGDHMEMLTGFLGFQFDDLAFSFTESDCGNPALMAHLRALKCERVFRRSYDEGLSEYVEFALGLMRKKDFPPALIEHMRARYEGPDAAARMRRAAAEYALETFGLTEQQLICMAYSPFAEKGAGLEEFFSREHPELSGRLDDIHALLAGGITSRSPELPAGEAHGDPVLAGALEQVSGLELFQLRVLYRSSVRRLGGSGGTDVIDAVLEGDPHKAVIRTRHAPDGPDTLEQISGR
ncbi:MAG TPA: hypothetical protein VGL63_10450 [Streptosporangiaceae bacterium]|jgi:hypothetical protein